MELKETVAGSAEPDSPNTRPRGAWGFAGLVTVAPSLLWLALLWLCSVPVLYEDEWTFVPFVVKLRAGALSFRDFWMAYAEHRLTLSRICFALFFGHGLVDPRPVMLCSWFLATATSVVGVRYLVWPWVCNAGILLQTLAGLAFSAWMLSLVQFENQLWGLQVGFVGTLCCVILGAAMLAAEGLTFGARLLGLVFIAGLATFTSGQGLLVWPAFGTGLALSARRWATRASVAALFLAGFGAALWLYQLDNSGQLSRSQSFGWVLSQPGLALRSMLGLLGSPLSYVAGFGRLQLAPWLGLSLLGGFLLLAIWAPRRDGANGSAPFVVLGLYGCAYAVLVTLGRANNGYNDWFLTSRYTTSALTLPLAVLGLGLWGRRSAADGHSLRAFHLTLAAAVVLALSNSFAAFRLARDESALRTAAMHLLDYMSIFDPDVDGVQTGPFYALCPIDGNRVLKWGVVPARQAGLIPAQRAVLPVERVQGWWRPEAGHHQVWYLAHRDRAERLSGRLQPRPGFRPDVVLVRPVGEQHFLTFGLVEGDRWQVILGQVMAGRLAAPVEVFALETATGRLAQLTP